MSMSRVRVREPVREQGRIVFEVPEDALAADHPARVLWQVVQTLDLSAFVAEAKAVEGRQGRDVLSPRSSAISGSVAAPWPIFESLTVPRWTRF